MRKRPVKRCCADVKSGLWRTEREKERIEDPEMWRRMKIIE